MHNKCNRKRKPVEAPVIWKRTWRNRRMKLITPTPQHGILSTTSSYDSSGNEASMGVMAVALLRNLRPTHQAQHPWPHFLAKIGNINEALEKYAVDATREKNLLRIVGLTRKQFFIGRLLCALFSLHNLLKFAPACDHSALYLLRSQFGAILMTALRARQVWILTLKQAARLKGWENADGHVSASLELGSRCLFAFGLQRYFFSTEEKWKERIQLKESYWQTNRAEREERRIRNSRLIDFCVLFELSEKILLFDLYVQIQQNSILIFHLPEWLVM